MDPDPAITEFVCRAAETVEWFIRLPPEVSGTPEGLRPMSLPGRGCFEGRWTRPSPTSEEELHLVLERNRACVDRLVLARRRLLGAEATPIAWRADWADEGRFLLFWPEYSLFSESMGPASEGFFELEGDLPPWGLWVTYLAAPLSGLRRMREQRERGLEADVLMCWVPRAWLARAQEGLENDETGSLAKFHWSGNPWQVARSVLALMGNGA